MADAGNGVVDVAATVSGAVLLVNNYGLQLDPLFAGLASGSGLGKLRLWARYCADADCQQPLLLVRAIVAGEDADGFYIYSTANTSGAGLAKSFTLPRAPLGTSYVQLIGDTASSVSAGKGSCASLDDCPADLDVVQAPSHVIIEPDGGSAFNPIAATTPVTINAANATAEVGTVYLGHLRFDGSPLWNPRPDDPGVLLAAISNPDDAFRNFIARFSFTGEAVMDPSSTVVQKSGAALNGDVCGMVRGGASLFVIGVDADGANVFEFSSVDGTQLSDLPVAIIPPANPADPATFTWPCRGAHGVVGGEDHLYLLNFKGAGALDQSRPHPLVHINVTTGTVTTPLDAYANHAWRGIAVSGTALFVVDMSWSLDATAGSIDKNRLISMPLDGSGEPGTPLVVTTTRTASDACESNAHWPGGLSLVALGGTPRLLMGHDTGISVHALDTLEELGNLDLPRFGRLFTQMSASTDGTRLYALPQCKAFTANSTFTLPYATGTEPSDSFMVAILDLSGSSLTLASTDIDVDADGTDEDGVELDFWRIKNYVRSFGSTLPIPPVVFTGPQFIVGESLLFVRGTGIQGDGSSSISSSGLGQAQDIAVYSLVTGQGLVLNEYMPWFDGLSSEAGTSRAIWGVDTWPGRESSVGWVEYLP